MWLLALFVAVPLVEISLFIQVGGAIGLWPTLGIVVITAVIGTTLVRTQGIQTMGRLRNSFSQLVDPTEQLAHGAMILFSGALLLTPGFFTDAVGFALLVPAFRTRVFHYLRARVRVQSFAMGSEQPRQRDPRGSVIDGEFEDITPPQGGIPGNSGWTRH